MSPELIRNLDLATKVAGEVSRLVPNSTSPIEAGRIFIPTANPLPGQYVVNVHERLHRVHNHGDSKIFDRQRDEIAAGSPSWDELFARTEKACKKSHVGNCVELSAIAFKNLKAQGAKSLDYVAMYDGRTEAGPLLPHVFVVIGRRDTGVGAPVTSIYEKKYYFDQRTDIRTPDTWGEDAVICDPWARIAYPAKDFEKFWDNARRASKSPETLTCYVQHRWEEPSRAAGGS